MAKAEIVRRCEYEFKTKSSVLRCRRNAPRIAQLVLPEGTRL
jgi:hypothetical protein